MSHCKGFTTRNKPCSKKPQKASDFCSIHQNQAHKLKTNNDNILLIENLTTNVSKLDSLIQELQKQQDENKTFLKLILKKPKLSATDEHLLSEHVNISNVVVSTLENLF